MPNILPVSDLRNYNEVLKNCQMGETVFLRKMAGEDYVVLYKVGKEAVGDLLGGKSVSGCFRI